MQTGQSKDYGTNGLEASISLIDKDTDKYMSPLTLSNWKENIFVGGKKLAGVWNYHKDKFDRVDVSYLVHSSFRWKESCHSHFLVFAWREFKFGSSW